MSYLDKKKRCECVVPLFGYWVQVQSLFCIVKTENQPKLTLTTNKAAESYNSCCLCFGKGKYTKSDEFLEQFQGGGRVIFNPKIYVADFRNFKQGFLIMKFFMLHVEGSGYAFSTIVSRKIKTRPTLKNALSECV